MKSFVGQTTLARMCLQAFAAALSRNLSCRKLYSWGDAQNYRAYIVCGGMPGGRSELYWFSGLFAHWAHVSFKLSWSISTKAISQNMHRLERLTFGRFWANSHVQLEAVSWHPLVLVAVLHPPQDTGRWRPWSAIRSIHSSATCRRNIPCCRPSTPLLRGFLVLALLTVKNNFAVPVFHGWPNDDAHNLGQKPWTVNVEPTSSTVCSCSPQDKYLFFIDCFFEAAGSYKFHGNFNRLPGRTSSPPLLVCACRRNPTIECCRQPGNARILTLCLRFDGCMQFFRAIENPDIIVFWIIWDFPTSCSSIRERIQSTVALSELMRILWDW